MLTTRRLITAACSLGFLSTTAQVVIVRELLVAFTGNELTIATTLALWLLSVAAGCFLFKRATRLKSLTATTLTFIMAGLAVLFQVVLIRALQPHLGAPGEVLPPTMILLLSGVGVAPGAVLIGGLFVNLVRLAESSRMDSKLAASGRIPQGQLDSLAAPISAVYGAEAVGSAAAGGLLSFYLLQSVSSYAALAVAAMVCLACGGLVLRPPAAGRWYRRRLIILVPAVLLGMVMVFDGKINLATRQLQWAPLRVSRAQESRYGSLVVTDRDGVYDFFESGSLAYTIPDPLYAEESAHIPLLCHPEPRRVLVVGGAGSGVLAEAAKHPSVESIDFVELDPQLIRVTEDYSPPGWLAAGSGVKITPIYGDGRRYVARSKEAYDVVILSVGTPVSLQTNRYYTVEFFRQVRRLLPDQGLVGFKIPSGGAYLSPDLGSLLASLLNACREVFPRVILLPGDYYHVVASPQLDLERRTDLLLQTLSQRDLTVDYLHAYYLWDRLSPLRRAYLDSCVASYDDGRSNSDLQPVSTRYAIARWAKHFQSGRVLAAVVHRLNPPACTLLLIASALSVSILAVYVTRFDPAGIPATLAIYSMGLTTMFTQILIILAFQIVSGYLYGRIAAMVAAFMFGMGMAASLIGARRISIPVSYLPGLHLLLACMPLVSIGAFKWLTANQSQVFLYGPELVFIPLAAASGVLGGLIFGVASSYLAELRGQTVQAGALSYAVDLLGATVAGSTTGFVIIPALGLAPSAAAFTVANVVLVIPILIGIRGRRRSLPR